MHPSLPETASRFAESAGWATPTVTGAAVRADEADFRGTVRVILETRLGED
jgi:hypothetical protein